MNYNAIAHGESRKNIIFRSMTALHSFRNDSLGHILSDPSTVRIRVKTALRRRYLSYVPSRGCVTHY